MSLAGLDTSAVVEAHQASIAESSGWFLLKYVAGSRDTVELLKRGSTGVNETRSAVETYEEKSPLYGLIHFRRRKIILKYVPDGTSRVLQVRRAVQFQSVLDAFTPHDTVFSFTTAPELTESALALSIMLLPSTASLPSSSSSEHRRRLNEISEDVEDNVEKPEQKESTPQAPEKATTPPEKIKDNLDELPASAQRAKALLAKRREMDTPTPEPTPLKEPVKSNTAESTGEVASLPPRKESLPVQVPAPLSSPGFDKALPALPDPSPTENTGLPDTETTSRPTTEIPSAPDASHPALTSAHLDHSRHLSAADSDSIKEWSNNVASFNAIKPKKKKLGPRPHVEGPSRPRTSGISEKDVRSRPVANLPTSVRIATSRPTTSTTNRPGSQQSSKSVPGRFLPSDSIHIMPPLPSPTHIASMYRPESRASIIRPASVMTEHANIPPEKHRLMKALQLRKRNMLIAQRASASTASTHTPSESLASTTTSAGVHVPNASTNANLAEPIDSRTLLTSSTASPTTLTNLSEVQSKASSFTSHEEPDKRCGSLSSDTSSSITPKAAIEGDKKRKSPKKSPARAHSSLTVQSSKAISKDQDPKPVADSENTAAAAKVKSIADSAANPRQPTQDELASRKDDRSEIQNIIPAGRPLSTSGSRTRRGRPVPEHLRMASAEISEFSEEDFMDELENATVQEAKPVSVARTPVTPVMSKVNSDRFKDTGHIMSSPIVQTRTQSQPRTQSPASSLGNPKSAGGRSGSTALPHWPPLPSEPSSMPLTNKSSLGTGISKRIKALEVLKTRESTSPPRQPVKSEPATRSAFSKFMKRSSVIVGPQRTPNASTENSPPKKQPKTPQKEHSSVVPQPWVQRQGSAPQVFHPTQKGETVSVTARIIRDEDDGMKRPKTEPGDVNLYQSRLIIEHERQDGDHSGASRDTTTADSKSPKAERGRFSFSSQRLPTADSFASKISNNSTGRKHLPRSQSDNSSLTEEKPKTSRANRLLKRMSNLTGGRRNVKNLPSNSHPDLAGHHHHPDTIEERIEPDARKPSVGESLLHVVDIGDVNVQFPESLLWKRRFIRIDDQGFLIFSPPANEANSRGVSRKFHLSDFRTPVLPDPEREEMAWSIIMDLKDGRSVQCACESLKAQRHVLQMLVDAHSAYHQLYGA